MPRLSVTEQAPGHYTVEGNLTFASIDKQSLKSFNFLKGMDSICIDLSLVGMTDSAGLALMIEWIKQARSNRVKLSFKNVPAQLLALAKLSGFDETEYFANRTP
ncbi:STAS domain-containing protein [Methylomonas sp. SURF-1]|uniref:STAS domain-containing protein n=1 Tax=Methylomonas aurea TaxID=2952224 RepID=A0ABT1UGR9_9GAMM|nr:STAS domain-containing protein [Methylomonas sp. SURF-1]MCQ8181418.1 STAS domain-containing protein [Methylomonas sp. SURF-1]